MGKIPHSVQFLGLGFLSHTVSVTYEVQLNGQQSLFCQFSLQESELGDEAVIAQKETQIAAPFQKALTVSGYRSRFRSYSFF